VKLFGLLPVLVVTRTELEFVSDEVEDAPRVGGGSAHNFTIAPEFVDERYLPWDEDRTGFGFGNGVTK
jgi:hypothetical protein